MLYIGVDTGGTFTDLVVMDDDGRVQTAKAPTTPGSLEQGVFDALELVAAERGTTLEGLLAETASFGYGTTQATNALIERKGAVTGLLTTLGFRDTLFVQRLMGITAGMDTDELGWYSRRRAPDPIVPRRLVREVPERIDQGGNVLRSLDEDATRLAVAELVEEGVESLAVCLLWSFRNPDHEQRVGEIVKEVAGDAMFVSLSSEVNPVIGEYERTATTVINSYLAPATHEYLGKLEKSLSDSGFTGTFSVLNSIGGVMGASEAAERAVLLLASGPTGGVIGSSYLAATLGHHNVITTDMGGTSFDVGLIIDDRPVVAGVTEVSKYHVSAPMIDITAIGAGGGSIATVEAGLIRVGPESAGAHPGPVCYGRGGERATVTDADLVLGIIDADEFLGGRMKLQRDAAVEAIRQQVAEPLGLSVEDAAAGIRQIVDSQMADTLRELTIGRGHDPRDFVLYAYGGAGPMHCAGYGAELGVGQIVVPTTSMVQSAYGALASDIHHSAERSYLMRGGGGEAALWDGLEPGALEERFAELEERCRTAMAGYGVADVDLELQRSVDLRYRSQTHELIIPVPSQVMDQQGLQGLIASFEESYEGTYGKGAGFRQAGIEITTFRVAAMARTRKPEIARIEKRPPSERRTRPIYDWNAGEFVDATVLDWLEMSPDDTVVGPGIIEHPTTTVFVSGGQEASLDEYGNIIIESRS